MQRKHPKSEERLYILSGQIPSFVCYPILLEGEAIEKQTSKETEKEKGRRQTALPTPKLVIFGGTVQIVTYYWKLTVMN